MPSPESINETKFKHLIRTIFFIALLGFYKKAFHWHDQYRVINQYNADSLPVASEADTAVILAELQQYYPNLQVLHEPVSVSTDQGNHTEPDFLAYDNRYGVLDGPVTAIESKPRGKQATKQQETFESGAPPNWNFILSNDRTRESAVTPEEHAITLLGQPLLTSLTNEY